MINFMYDKGLLVMFYSLHHCLYGRIVNRQCYLSEEGNEEMQYDIITKDGQRYSIEEKDVIVCYRQVAAAVDKLMRV